jgi:hypothetical protein
MKISAIIVLSSGKLRIKENIVMYKNSSKRKMMLRKSAMKQLDVGGTVKAISSFRKTLVEANKQAMMALDDIENAIYSDSYQSAVASDITNVKNMQEALKLCEKASEYVQTALKLTDNAKKCMRGDLGNAVSSEPARSYRNVRRNRRIAKRSHAMRGFDDKTDDFSIDDDILNGFDQTAKEMGEELNCEVKPIDVRTERGKGIRLFMTLSTTPDSEVYEDTIEKDVLKIWKDKIGPEVYESEVTKFDTNGGKDAIFLYIYMN